MHYRRLIPDDTSIDFMRRRWQAFALTLLLSLASIISLGIQGLALGLDFTGGLLLEARTSRPHEVGDLRERLDALELGPVELQQFGEGSNEIMIRAPAQPGPAQAQDAAIDRIAETLGPDWEIRRTESVGPQVSHEFLVDGVMATVLATAAIAVYVWLRYEWQFGLAALLTTFHDVLVTVGLFSLLQLEFDLTTIAALLTIAGYSVNDTVVIFDRIRENLRRYKATHLSSVINQSVNQTLSRTLITGSTTLLASLSLLMFGGTVLFDFALAITFGILVGTYSSIFVASALLLHLPAIHRGVTPTPTPPAPAERGP